MRLHSAPALIATTAVLGTLVGCCDCDTVTLPPATATADTVALLHIEPAYTAHTSNGTTSVLFGHWLSMTAAPKNPIGPNKVRLTVPVKGSMQGASINMDWRVAAVLNHGDTAAIDLLLDGEKNTLLLTNSADSVMPVDTVWRITATAGSKEFDFDILQTLHRASKDSRALFDIESVDIAQ